MLPQLKIPHLEKPAVQDDNKADDPLVLDGRFRDLLGNAAWNTLPSSVRKRFGKKLKGGNSHIYQGQVTHMEMSFAGRALAQLARLIGAPLPFDTSSVGQPAIVSVTEDANNSGQFWIRQYGKASGFPQVVHSSKRFAGPTGLEEYIGCGIGMALQVEARCDTLLFLSDHYFLQLFGKKIRIPKALTPFNLVIGHHDLGNHSFKFSLRLESKVFGQLIEQDAIFKDAPER